MTSANDEHPTQRLVLGYHGAPFIVELSKGRISVRPKGAKKDGPNERSISPSALLDLLVLRG